MDDNEFFNSIDTRRAKTPMNESEILKAKLDEVLEEVQKMTQSIVSLLKEPTGSNPLVNKLESEVDAMKKLVNNLKRISDLRSSGRKAETIEEARKMAEDYFNMLGVERRLRKKKAEEGGFTEQVEH